MGPDPVGVLILCPGQNGDGGEFLADAEWSEFCRRNRLALVVPHFVSPDEDLKSGRGYFVAERGSGKMLVGALEEAGLGGLPLMIFGFSGGAHFAMSFAAFAPDRVAAFCAYSFAWWSPPPAELICPALIACGQFDGLRYGSSFAYFQAGRRLGKPWTWASVAEQDHAPDEELEGFVREYFQSILGQSPRDWATVDNVLGTRVEPTIGNRLMTSALPCESLVALWRKIHHP